MAERIEGDAWEALDRALKPPWRIEGLVVPSQGESWRAEARNTKTREIQTAEAPLANDALRKLAERALRGWPEE